MPPQLLELNEPIVHGIVAQFEANVDEITQAINANVTDGVTIERPAQILDYSPPPGIVEGGLPLIGVGDVPSQFRNDLVTSLDADHGLAIIAYVQNADPQALAWQLRRTAQMVTSVVQVDRTFGGACWTTRLGNVIPGDYLAPKRPDAADASWLSWFWLLITCPRSEI